MATERVTIEYRPALDGIRAIAVMAVFGYHLGVDQLRGGFLGVDVFFVLSGYLITTLLLLERSASGSIDLLRFWVRRAKRLLPALLLLLVAVTVWINLTAPDFELAQRRLDLQWALFYGSNWHLIASAQDYFAQGAGVSIVRHTWSLAIEEQFYLVWPLVVSASLWLARGRVRGLVAICALGVGGSAMAMTLLERGIDPSRAYYGTDARVHQLLIGALLAIAMVSVPSMRAPRRAGGPVAVLSLLALGAAFVGLDDASSLYYRGGSIIVALVAAAVIWSLDVARSGIAARALGVRPMRAVGRVSYGIYLWHWPVIVAVATPAALLGWLPEPLGTQATRVLITLGVAGLSFVCVERPILQGRLPRIMLAWPRYARASIGGFVAVSGFAVVATTIAVLTTGSSLQAEAATSGGATELDRLECTLEICVRHRGSPTDPVIAVIGDSIGRSFDLGLVERAASEGWTYLTASAGGCRVTPLVTHADGQEGYYRECVRSVPPLLEELRARWSPDLVIVVENMELHDFERDGRVVMAGSPEWRLAERRGLEGVVRGFVEAGSDIVIVEAAPNVLPERCMRADRADDASCVFPAVDDPIATAFNRIAASVTSRFPDHAWSVSITPYLCPDSQCSPSVGGIVPRYDGHHYSTAGSRWVVPLLLREIRMLGAFPD
jgi:peptidoglycan/LPS O-acetylase OafA/YrhL